MSSQLNTQQISRTITDGVLGVLGQDTDARVQGSGFTRIPSTEHLSQTEGSGFKGQGLETGAGEAPGSLEGEVNPSRHQSRLTQGSPSTTLDVECWMLDVGC